MRSAKLGIFCLAFIGLAPVVAQAQGAPTSRGLVVSTCGAQTFPLLQGGQPAYAPFTILQNGTLCTGGSGSSSSGGASYGLTSPGSAPSGTNANAPLLNGFLDASGLMRAVSPTTPFPSVAEAPASDVRGSGTLNAASTSSVLDIPLNGAATVGLNFSGLAASGATVSFFESNNGTTPIAPVSSLNAATGVSSPTRTTDGDTRIAVNGHTTLRVQVTTAGSGTITVGYNVSTAPGIVDIRAPLPPGGNQIGTIGNAGFNALQGGAATSLTNPIFVQLSQAGAALSSSNGLPTTDTNASQTITAPGTAASKLQGVQGASGMTPIATNQTQIAGAAIAAPTAYGTGPSSGVVPAVNAFITSGVYANVGAYIGSADTFTAGTITYNRLSKDGNLRNAETGSSDPLVGIVPNSGSGATCATNAATTGCIAKNSQGNLYHAYATATSAPTAQQYLVCINAASVPTTGTSLPTGADYAPFNLATTAGSSATINLGAGPPSDYPTGIVCLISTSLTTYTAGTAAFINTSVR